MPPTSLPKKRTGFTLLDDDNDDDESSIKENPDKSASPVPKSSNMNMENDTVMENKEEDLYNDILNQAAQWKSQLEGTRDELSILRLQNAIVMDSLTMAGADV